MLIDGNLLASGFALRAEYCVIGSGMGGAAVAQKLSAAGRDVLLVEAGGREDQAGDAAPVTAEHAGRPFVLPLTRTFGLGGTSNRWHGICAPLDEIDFEPRPWIAGSGWPLRRADLSRHYDEAAALLGVPDAARFEPGLLDPELRLRLGDLAFDRAVLQSKLVQVPRQPRRWRDTLLDLARARRLRCLIHAPALELLVDESGRRITGLVAGVAAGTVHVQADTFVVCAGALETPRLLLNSRRRLPAGLGNAGDLVGRHLLDHPMGHFCKLRFHAPLRAPLYASMALNRHVHAMAGLMLTFDWQRQHQLANHYLWLRPSVTLGRIDDELLLSFLAVRGVRDLGLRQIKAILTHRDILYRILVHRFGWHPRYRYGDLFFMTEQLPNPESRVGLSERRHDRHGYPVARIDWQLAEADLAGFAKYARLLFAHGLCGAQYALARVDQPEVWRQTVASSAHHLGTARMAEHPARGVVDPNLQVFGTDNLFVCDGSVFATAGSVNPSLTIVALGLRLAEHLLRRAQAAAATAVVAAPKGVERPAPQWPAPTEQLAGS